MKYSRHVTFSKEHHCATESCTGCFKYRNNLTIFITSVVLHLHVIGPMAVFIATRLWAGQSGLDSRLGKEMFLFPIASRPGLGPTQAPIQWAPGALSPGVTRQVHKATTHLQFVSRSGMVELYLHHPYAFMA
jgi:hypothetical protein